MLCGIDEAGRGPLAGPVTAAAVILPKGFDTSILKDSKKLSEKKREEAARIILAAGSLWHVGHASNKKIDEINILQATLLAMKRAYEGLCKKAQAADVLQNSLQPLNIDVIVDGNVLPTIVHCRSLTAVVKADDTVPEVMAASIVAKVMRDKMMSRYARLYPEYGYEKHKGYGTQAHRKAIRLFGPSPIQRNSFSIKNEPPDQASSIIGGSDT